MNKHNEKMIIQTEKNNSERKETNMNQTISENNRTNIYVPQVELTPDYIIPILKERKRELEQVVHILKQTERENPNIDTVSDIHLRISQKKAGTRYYIKANMEKKWNYIRKEDMDRVYSIAQKSYNQKAMDEIISELNAISTFLKAYQPDKISEIMESMHSSRQQLINPIFLSLEDYIDRWMKEEYEKKEIDETVPEYYSENGVRVRSKSEIIIANKLEKYEIPYRYEFPIYFKSGICVHPDFYCLNCRTRKEIVWEHFGMMDNVEYANNAIHKIDEYQKNGFWTGINFVTTFESGLKSINVNLVEQIITRYLL